MSDKYLILTIIGDKAFVTAENLTFENSLTIYSKTQENLKQVTGGQRLSGYLHTPDLNLIEDGDDLIESVAFCVNGDIVAHVIRIKQGHKV